MSVINKKPFIKKLLDACTEEQLSTLKTLINGSGNQSPIKRTLNINPTGDRTNITASDKGVSLCNLEVEYSLFNGYLVYVGNNPTYCVLIVFTDAQVLKMFEIVGRNFNAINEELSITELRMELEDATGDLIDSSSAKVFQYNAGTVLTQEIYDGFKDGDILKCSNISFVISKQDTATPKAITTAAVASASNVSANLANISWSIGSELQVSVNTYDKQPIASGVVYSTTAPTANNTDGDVKIVVLSVEPDTRYDGYLYIITEAVA